MSPDRQRRVARRAGGRGPTADVGARRRGLLLGAIVTVLLGACGIPADDDPRAVSQEQLPSTTTTVIDEDQAVAVELTFVRPEGEDGVLVTVEREIPVGGESGQPTPTAVLEALFTGVTAEERASGDLVSRIPPDTSLASPPALSAGTLTVDLDDRISAVQGGGARMAYGQMVCTLTELEGVDGVLFQVDGEGIEPPDGSGQASSAPLTCTGY